jgi:hypothetical protein
MQKGQEVFKKQLWSVNYEQTALGANVKTAKNLRPPESAWKKLEINEFRKPTRSK